MKNLSLIIALLLMIGSQAGAECGNLCDKDWWVTATKADVQAELDGVADFMARNMDGTTPLHQAAQHIDSLLEMYPQTQVSQQASNGQRLRANARQK